MFSVNRESECRRGCAGELDEAFDGVVALLSGGDEEAGQHRLGVRSVVGSVAVVRLAVDDGWADRLFGAPVRGVGVMGEEREDRVGLTNQMASETWLR